MKLETSRLILRDYEHDDMKYVHEYSSNPEVVKYMLWGPNTKEETREFIKQAIATKEQEPRRNYEFGVVLKETGRFIGGCGIRIEEKNGELGYCFNPNYWGRGYASEASKELLNYGFITLKLHRIYATCRPSNIGSARVLEKIGMKREGHLREHIWSKHTFHDSYLHSILFHEFQGI